MGLDMYLNGTKFLTSFDQDRPKEDGFSLSEKIFEIGYWRKHPNLHGYIVETFADGVDECQTIELSKENLDTIIEAVTANDLPHTSGFFFGESDGSEKKFTLKVFKAALKWLKDQPKKGEWRSVNYRASW